MPKYEFGRPFDIAREILQIKNDILAIKIALSQQGIGVGTGTSGTQISGNPSSGTITPPG